MKALIAALFLTSFPIAHAGDVEEGLPCKLEGERAYLPNREDHRNSDVFVCEKGAWKFLFTQEWNDSDQQ